MKASYILSSGATDPQHISQCRFCGTRVWPCFCCKGKHLLSDFQKKFRKQTVVIIELNVLIGKTLKS